MRITTLNFKHENYLENHEIYVGTQTGSFKRIFVANEKPHQQENLQDLKTLTQDSRITALAFGDNDSDEVLIGRQSKNVQTYSTSSKCFQSIQEFSNGPIVGLAKYNDKIFAGIENGIVEQDSKLITLAAGDNISRMRQSPYLKNFIATGGKDRQNCLKVFDMEKSKEIFKSKNLPNDSLQLEVPIWDSDLGFIDGNTIATCSRYGYIRVYDIRKQRRPVLKYVAPEEQMSFCSLTSRENFIYCGSTMGIAKAFDIRKFKTFAHTYKGFTGTVSDLCLDASGKYLISSCLDRYVRVHHTASCVMQYQCYVKSKATRVLVKTLVKTENENEDEEVTEKVLVQNNSNDNSEQECSDQEYEDLFANMSKIKESDAKVEKQASKRKPSQNNFDIKKKKILK